MKQRLYLCLCMLCVLAVSLYAQDPAITSISPDSGPIGTEVTIYGTGFLSSENVIYFQNATTSMIYEARITTPSPDGVTLVFTVPQATEPECYYSVPACASPSLPVNDGVYLVYVVISTGTSNAKEFIVTGTSTPTPTVDPDCISGIYGDTNEDGTITIVDALIVAQTYVGIIGLFTPPCADVNRDGFIDIVDALLIAQCYVGLIPCNF